MNSEKLDLYDSIDTAKELYAVDESTLIILDANKATWLAYITTNAGEKILLLCQYDGEIALSYEAERKLRDWILQQ